MNLIAFKFQEVSLQEACWIDGKPYFTRRAIGEWLGYKNPRDAIDKIIARNPHIDCPVPPKLGGTAGRYQWSRTVPKLGTVDGKKYDTRVYDPIGLQLIVFESRQPKAIAYKIAVANLVWAFMNGEIKPSKWSERGDLIAAARQIHSMRPCVARGPLMRDLAEREGCSLSTIYRRIARVSGKRLREKVRKDKGCKQKHSIQPN